MIQRVVEQASKSNLLSRVIVATDDRRILESVLGFGEHAVMTPGEIETGTDRAAWAAAELDAEIIVNIQGDEPFIAAEDIDKVVKILIDDENVLMGTLIKKITDHGDLENPNTVKVVLDENFNALYFSRSPIPFFRDFPNKAEWLKKADYFKHIGIYSYRKEFLEKFSSWKPSPLEKIEKLEQLRALQRGITIRTAVTDREPLCVDTADDLELARKYFEQNENRTA